LTKVGSPWGNDVVAVCSATADATVRSAYVAVPASANPVGAVAAVSCPSGQLAVSGGLGSLGAVNPQPGDAPDTEHRLGFAAPVTTSAAIPAVVSGDQSSGWLLQARGSKTRDWAFRAFTVCVTATPATPAPAPTQPTPKAPVPADTTAPQTVAGTGPAKQGTATKATFTFTSEPGATFTCTLDRKAPTACSSPYKLKRLARGKHRLVVTSVDAAGNADPTPVVFTWKVTKPRRHR
jgi:hypothetical protein